MASVRFEGRKENRQKLLACGFEARGDRMFLCRDLADGQMRLDLTVESDGTVTTAVTDVATDEEYVLHLVPEASGAFVGRVRAEYQAVLDELCERCFDFSAFTAGQSRKLVEFAHENYGEELEFLWDDTPDCAIWRRSDNRKWYGLLMVISKRKFGLDTDERIEVLNFRHNAEKDGKIVDGQRYFPAYHMNKTHWVSALLDGSVPTEELTARRERSRALALKKG